ncbi:MAG: YvrJ family protein [Enterococcus sp.]|nr:YvrJ family protein [Enterococcus sp.]
MDNELIRYILEQSGALLIALLLIMRVEVKLDGLTGEISRLTDTITAHVLSLTKNSILRNDTR